MASMSSPGVSRRRFLQYTGLGAAAAIGATGCTAAAGGGGSSAAAKPTLPNGWTGTIADVRHVGHADILREQTDGATGVDG